MIFNQTCDFSALRCDLLFFWALQTTNHEPPGAAPTSRKIRGASFPSLCEKGRSRTEEATHLDACATSTLTSLIRRLLESGVPIGGFHKSTVGFPKSCNYLQSSSIFHRPMIRCYNWEQLENMAIQHIYLWKYITNHGN